MLRGRLAASPAKAWLVREPLSRSEVGSSHITEKKSMILKTTGAMAALALTCLVLNGCVDEGDRYSNHRYVPRDDRNLGYSSDEYRGRGSQHDGIDRPANDRISEEYGGTNAGRSGGNRSNNAGNSGSGQSGRGEVFTPPGG